MRRKEQRPEPGRKLRGVVLFVLLALILPVSVNILRAGGSLIAPVGERVAAFAVIANMPEAGAYLLFDRFLGGIPTLQSERDEPPGEHHSLPVAAMPSTPLPNNPPYSQAVTGQNPLVIRPRIPIQYQAMLVAENFAGMIGGQVFAHGAGLIRNDTRLTNDEIKSILETPHSLTFVDNGQPQVLIYHTHATEAFERHDSEIYDIRNTWRSNDNNINIVAVGAVLAEVLEQNGISVIHNSTQHDFPSYNRSYERSAVTVADYLARYPSIQIVLDIHRDAIERDNHVIVKPVAEINGQTAAQVMILAGSDNGNLNMPNWQENLRFAAAFQDAMESRYPQLTRPVWLRHRRYNQHLSDGALLLEIGSNANTLEEAVYSATLVGRALAGLIKENTVD
ncbi:MAG: stage II sporulation protein P [Oscillospiraceae bacterium]|nr:stage II sporulation protein P [Oscillospiraceae bacterium]